MIVQHLNQVLGNIDIYLLDQVLKDNIKPDAKILDAGCGEGRNLIYFLNNGFDVHGLDINDEAIQMLHFIIGSNYNHYSKSRFQVADLANLPYQDSSFDYVICSAVLHFSTNAQKFWSSVSELHRVLSTNGTLFIRMTSDIGLNDHQPTDTEHIYQLPDSSIRFLLNHDMISLLKEQFHFEELEPIKTVLVDDKRSMTTLILRKNK